MKEKIKTFFCVLILLVVLPYVITIVLQGKNSMEKDILVSAPQNTKEKIEIEERLIGIVAAEIPIGYDAEALKAQAVIARTNLMAAMETGSEPPKYLTQAELKKLWTTEGTNENYQRLTKAIKATEGVVITHQGNYIYAAFHAVSAGKTRSAKEALGSDKMPWLVSVDSLTDIPSEDYLRVIFVKKEELLRQLKISFPDVAMEQGNLMESLVIESRDTGDYVTTMKIGTKAITGEEFRKALKLNSACFFLKEVEGEIRIVTKGLGHGFGMSQYGANELAIQGASYLDILNYYFKNIEISD